ncbi:MAG: PrsW family glutamic-type intramembrane protease [Anaerolineae bacterium]
MMIETLFAGLFRSRRGKQALMVLGVLLALPGFLLGPAFVCAGVAAGLAGEEAAAAFSGGMTLLVLATLSLAGGGGLFWHSYAAAQGKQSAPLRLKPAWMLAGVFGLLVVAGLVTAQKPVAGLVFPPVLAVAATLPPLAAISWFAGARVRLTWRRGLPAFFGGATVGLFVAIVLEILLPLIVLALVFNLGKVVIDRLEALFGALAGENIATAITGRGFIYLFVQLAIIAPLAEEFAKPLVTLPFLGRMSRRGAFLLGALAGAGFAALENILYAGFGFSFWAGILLVRALGGAIHPLGAGLVALGWRDVLRGQPQAWKRWLARFGLAAGMHALWNGGSLLVITLAGAQFFGQLPPDIDLLGLSAAGTTLAALIILGLVSLWLGRSVAQRVAPAEAGAEAPAPFTLSDRGAAIWGLACLAAIVPAGIAGLQLLVK